MDIILSSGIVGGCLDQGKHVHAAPGAGNSSDDFSVTLDAN